jgi:hypothetical protein
MAEKMKQGSGSFDGRTRLRRAAWHALVGTLAAVTGVSAFAQGTVTCARELTANVVAFDQPIMYNRLGASNINGMMFALRRDVVDSTGTLIGNGGTPGNVALRPDKRPRPLVLRIAAGDCLTITVTNLLTPAANANPFTPVNNPPPNTVDLTQPEATVATKPPSPNLPVNDQVLERTIGFHVNGMQLTKIGDDGSNVGKNASSLIPQGGFQVYKVWGEKEGVFLIQSQGATLGADANQGHSAGGLFGQIIVEPKRAKIYRSILTEEEMRLAADKEPRDGVLTGDELTPTRQPKIDYEARYPLGEPWASEGKAGKPILNMIDGTEIVHSELEAIMMGTGPNGTFLHDTYPLESIGRRNPTVPNRLEPFRDFAQVWHDEPSTAQAFPGFYNNPVLKYVLAGVKDGFMINYGSGGIGSEIIANRLGVGPMHDCLDCTYEEFFLTSFTVGDPALLVDIPANFGLENYVPGDPLPVNALGPKATKALYPADPLNVHHAYTGDFIKFRNTHIGKEQHVFHLHNHQWLYNPNDDNSNYLDAQGIGPGIGYTYEINFGGAGNRNKTAGDAIFHCHFYPHFAQGMWYHQRNYDVFEAGTLLSVTPNDGLGNATGYHVDKWELLDGTPAAKSRALPDGELLTGVPLVAIVPLPGKPMPPMPGRVEIVENPTKIPLTHKNPAVHGRAVGSVAKVDRTDKDASGKLKSPGYPFWVAGIDVGEEFVTAEANGPAGETPEQFEARLAVLSKSVVGQRPPTPLLDMATPNQVTAIQASDPTLFATLNAAQADGWDGGLPRHALRGYAAGGDVLANVVSPRDFTKIIHKAAPVYYPEGGTDVERASMRHHGKATGHETSVLNVDATTGATVSVSAGTYRLNGVGPVIGAPFNEPCRDDAGTQLTDGYLGQFFGAPPGSAAASAGRNANGSAVNPVDFMTVRGKSNFNATTPRIYKGVNIQFDAVMNKVGYHYPQQRIITLWQDANRVINKQQPPEPLVMRLNTFDCAVFSHSNLVPEYFEMDDYQVRTPTDIIGQHIHLPKWDLTTADGAANGWNYEDGTLSPGAVRERIESINRWNEERVCNNELPVTPPSDAQSKPHDHPYTCPIGTARAGQTVDVPVLEPAAHPYFGQFGRPDWKGARTTMQRWFADPVVNADGVDRGLGIIFTHDHYGPSTHQQVGLYATVLAQPANSKWVHNETGAKLGPDPDTRAPARTAAYTPEGLDGHAATFTDGGPTSWQAAILPQAQLPGVNVNAQDCPIGKADGMMTSGVSCQSAFREFYLEFSDFQHAYEFGKYVGADEFGNPRRLPTEKPYALPEAMPFAGNDWIPNSYVGGTVLTEAFRYAINPPARFQVGKPFPDLVEEVVDCVKEGAEVLLSRPCPQAISVADPGMFVVNYRNEPVALRIFDPAKPGPDGKMGAQADGDAGDLAFALATRKMDKAGTITPIVRKEDAMNRTEQELIAQNKLPAWSTLNAPNAKFGGDPFTPMLRAYQGDLVRVKIQAGGHEEEHNATILGLKWLQAGSGFGRAPNSGWRNSQAAGISEQFTLNVPMFTATKTVKGTRDYLYNIDASMDGWWSGTWGLLRAYDALRAEGDLFVLPNNPDPTPARVVNRDQFNGVCPKTAPIRPLNVIAILANDLLGDRTAADVKITPIGTNLDPTGLSRPVGQLHAGGPLTGTGSLIYNPRTTATQQVTIAGENGNVTVGGQAGPLHDPTAMMYVRLEDVTPAVAGDRACRDSPGTPGVTKPGCRIKLIPDIKKPEPWIARAKAGECVTVTLYNRLPAVAPDLPTLGMLLGVNKHDRGAEGTKQGSIPFDVNRIRPSSHVGMVPQLVAVDPIDELGINVGVNVTQTVPPVNGNTVAKAVYKWYTGDVRRVPKDGTNGVDLVPVPVEFGGVGISPADRVKQGQKSLVGGFSVLPEGATFVEDPGQHAQATVMVGEKEVRDLVVVMTKNLNHRYASGAPVEHINGEGVGIPEDSQEGGAMALNYGIEPLWFRFGIAPNLPFGNATCALGTCYGGIPNQHMAYSNALVSPTVTCVGATCTGDPATPVLKVKPGRETRLHFAVPHSTSRGTTIALHGHVWQRDPYVCDSSRYGLLGACLMTEVGSRKLGDNPLGFAQGAQESFTSMAHWTYFLPKAGGADAIEGDFLFKDIGSFGNASGLWGILRVDRSAP